MLPVAILAGGLATRLRPVTEKIPKFLVEVAGEPFAAHQMRLLKRSGVERVVVCTGFLGEMIEDYLGGGGRFGLEIAYSPDGERLRGTAGALKRALPLLGGAFLAVYGDSYLPCDYRAVERAFLESGKAGLMTVFRNEGRWDTSNVEFGNGRILAYDKRHRTPRMRHIDYGLGAFRPEAFDGLAEGAAADLAGVYQDLLARGELAAFETGVRFYEAGSFGGLEELARYLASEVETGGQP
jgi:NDP-sugar pyrophosphorylase family protein